MVLEDICINGWIALIDAETDVVVCFMVGEWKCSVPVVLWLYLQAVTDGSFAPCT